MSNPLLVEIDPRDITITPVFKYVQLENVPKSETAGYAVMETHEVVEVRFAGTKNFAPVFPVDAQAYRVGNRTVTYAERWPEQYRAFKEGSPQEAMGTPLEMLRPFGITPNLISMCRAMSIYSIEALIHLEGDRLKNLGMNANRLKDAARKFMAQQQSLTGQADQIEALKAEIEALKAGGAAEPPAEQTPPEVIDEMVQEADDAFAALSDSQIKDEIAGLTGKRPAGNPSRATLVSALKELQAA